MFFYQYLVQKWTSKSFHKIYVNRKNGRGGDMHFQSCTKRLASDVMCCVVQVSVKFMCVLYATTTNNNHY